MTKEHKSHQSIVPVEHMAQNQGDASVEGSNENNENVLKDTDEHVKRCEENGPIDDQPITKDILGCLDVASLSIPDCMMNDAQDVNLAFLETIKIPLKHIASFQTGNNFNVSSVYLKHIGSTNIMNLILSV